MHKDTHSFSIFAIALTLVAMLIALNISSTSQAQSRTGFQYIVVPYDEKSTLRRFKRDSEEGNHVASILLGSHYLAGVYVDFDLDEAVRLYRNAANAGYQPAQVIFASHQLGRQGILVDPYESLDWLMRAAENKYPTAYIMLADFYRAGIAVPADIDQALKYLELAANSPMIDISKKPRNLKQYARFKDNGSPYSYPVGNSDVMNLSNGRLQLVGKMSRDIKLSSKRFKGLYEAIEYYNKISVNQSIIDAQYALGRVFEHGMGVPADHKKAFEWYSKAQQSGHHNASLSLGWFYEKGYYVEQDYLKAMDLYEKGSELENAQSTANVGHLYDQGFGVETDYKKAIKWFKKALKIDENLATANRALAIKYMNGEGIRKNEKKAFEHTLLAAQKKDGIAAGNMAVFYFNGITVEKNPETAIEWYEKAARYGHVESMRKLGVNYRLGVDDFIKADPVKSYMWYNLAALRGEQSSIDALAELKATLSEQQIIAAENATEQWLVQN